MRPRLAGGWLMLAGSLAVVSALGTSACTLIGAGVGSTIQTTDRKQMRPVSPWELVTVSSGAWVVLRLRDGRAGAGRFDGLVERAQPEYARAYEAACHELEAERVLPALGEGGTVRTTRQANGSKPGTPCKLLGFDYSHAVCAGLNAPRSYELDEVAALSDASGRSVDGPALQKLILAGRVPVRGALSLSATPEARAALAGDGVSEKGGKKLAVVPEAVASVEVSGTRRHTFEGLVVGALVDAVILVNALRSGPDTSYSGGGGGQSCPFVYSFDGERYVLDAEPFGGSFVEAAQRRVWSRLDHLREADGRYRVRVTDELDEVEHLDEVKLLVVDHPPGAVVAPDLFGAVHALVAPVAARRARDARGADLVTRLASPDADAWLGNPFGRDARREADLRDALVLEFPRPAGASAATLLVRARSTPWFPELFRRVLALPGAQREAWYAGLASDPRAGASLLSFAAEAFPRVELWTGSGFRRVGMIGELPTVAWGVQAIRFDLSGVPGDVVRLRLDGLPGTWRLDHAVIGYAPEPAVEVVELSAREADRGGQDVREALRARDGVRLDLHRGDLLDLTFAAPPAREGRARSLVLKAAGYYTILFATEERPQMTRFESVLTQPGALARFAAEQADESLREAAAATW